MINVYLDDLRDCPIGFVVARTFQEAIHLLENHEVDILSLDHDLGEDLQGWNVNTNLNSSFKGGFVMKWLDMEPLRA